MRDNEKQRRVARRGAPAGRAERSERGRMGDTPRQDPPQFIRLSGPIEHDSIVNGPGLRAVVWTQGCPNHCPGCQNPETWDFESGVLVDLEEVKAELASLKGQTGLTFCGGEPFVQPAACLEIAQFAHEKLGWNVWSFSGFTYEQIKDFATGKSDRLGSEFVNYAPDPSLREATLAFLNELDALIDGPFILKERDLTLKFRGSRNQRILHLDHGRITSEE